MEPGVAATPTTGWVIEDYIAEQIAEMIQLNERKLGVLRQCRKSKKKRERREFEGWRVLANILARDSNPFTTFGAAYGIDRQNRRGSTLDDLFGEGTSDAIAAAGGILTGG